MFFIGLWYVCFFIENFSFSLRVRGRKLFEFYDNLYVIVDFVYVYWRLDVLLWCIYLRFVMDCGGCLCVVDFGFGVFFVV